MGWNDRLPEDPYTSYQEEQDRIAAEAWHEYLLMMEEEAGVSSQNLQADDLKKVRELRAQEHAEEMRRFIDRVHRRTTIEDIDADHGQEEEKHEEETSQ